MDYFQTNSAFNKSQQGFAILPIIIVLAAVIMLGGGGVAVYQLRSNNETEKATLHQEIELREEEPTQEPEESLEKDTQESNEEVESSPTASPDTTANSAVKAATAVPVTSTSTTESEPNIPLIIEQEFYKVYGRNPALAESNEWKNKYRVSGWSQSQLYNALVAAKQASATKQPVIPPSTPTPTPTPPIRSQVFTVPTQQPTPTTDLQEQLRQQQIAQKRAELSAELSDVRSQRIAISKRMSELLAEIEKRESIGGPKENIRRITEPLIAEYNSLVPKYNALIEREDELTEQINLLNLL